MNKSELTAKANDVTERRLEHWPAFDLFRLAERCFIECVEDLPEGSFDGEYYEILSGLRSTFSQMATVESAFANIFIDVWFCSNFTQSTWRGICAAKSEYAILAVEHCYFVLAGSGADGSAELTQLLDHFDAWNDVRRRLDQTPELHELGDWVETLAPGASSSC